jgi:hypothetical protein
MNTQLLIDTAKARFSHNSSRAYLTEKYSGKLNVVSQNGIWKADLQTISFLAAWSADTLVMIDLYENIVKVDRVLLLNTLKDLHYQVMSDWHAESHSLAKRQ